MSDEAVAKEPCPVCGENGPVGVVLGADVWLCRSHGLVFGGRKAEWPLMTKAEWRLLVLFVETWIERDGSFDDEAVDRAARWGQEMWHGEDWEPKDSRSITLAVK